jgi:hypothetical protein
VFRRAVEDLYSNVDLVWLASLICSNVSNNIVALPSSKWSQVLDVVKYGLRCRKLARLEMISMGDINFVLFTGASKLRESEE